MVSEKYVVNLSDNPPYYIILADFKFWAEHSVELHEWCEKTLERGTSAFQGSLVTLNSMQEYTLFELRWG
jgi:hypothetical protein